MVRLLRLVYCGLFMVLNGVLMIRVVMFLFDVKLRKLLFWEIGDRML